MADLLSIYVHIMAARMRAQLQYRVSFVLQLVGSFSLSFTDFAVVLVIFAHLPYLAGWSLGEVAFLYGTSYMAFQLSDIAVGQLDQLPVLIQSGDFDMVLIRPLGALFQVVTLDFTLRRFGAFGQGALVFALALARTDIHWTAGRVLVLTLMPVWSIPIFASVWVVGATSAFWAVRSMEVINLVTHGGQLLTQYPLQVFGAWIQRLVIFVVPLAFVNYFPSLYVLGKPDPLGAPEFVRFASPVVAIVLVVVAGRIWNFGVRHYRSTGS